MEDGWREEGFDNLREHGFTSDYVRINAKEKLVSPAWTLEHLIEDGFFPRGTKVRFLNKNGYDSDRNRAASILDTETIYVVENCNVGDWSSTYQFYGIDGHFNTVMFESID